MTLTNTGHVVANDVAPAELLGVLNGALSEPGPAMLTIPGGSAKDFTWIYASAQGDAGEIGFSTNASGKDDKSGKVVSFAAVSSNAVTVQTPAVLTASLAVSPVQLSEGQEIKIMMTVTNTGQADADAVSPAIVAAPVNGIMSAPDPVNASIPGGGIRNFTWTYISASGDASDVIFSGSASGKDHNSGNRISSTPISSNVIRIHTPANLTATITASDPLVSAGQNIVVVMTVSNSGQATADAVLPSALTLTGIQTLRLSANPPPVGATIPGGGRQDFAWVYASAEGDAGNVMFSGNASGRDHNTGNSVSFNAVDSNVVGIQTPANLAATIAVSPTQISGGQDVTVVMTVNNIGQAAADAVLPSVLNITGLQTMRLSSSPTNANADIPGGGSHDFEWIYTSAEGDTGNVMFSGNASGKDHNTGKKIMSIPADSSVLTVRTSASLTGVIATSPEQISEGQEIKVVMTVTNEGQSLADAVMPAELTLVDAQGLSLSSGPVPGNASISGGGSQDFTWTYISAKGSAGDVAFSGNASGRDHGSGKALTFAPVNSNAATIQTPANLSMTINASPIRISRGQETTITMKVANSGQAGVDFVTPSIQADTANGTLSSPTPTEATIPGGGSQNFTWIYTSSEEDVESVIFTGNVSGKDHNSRNVVSLEGVDSNVLRIQTPANLTATLSVSPAKISEGQDVRVTMTVTNSGEADADDVMPSAPTLKGVQTLKLSASPKDAKADIPSGRTQYFTWIYATAAGDAGSVMFSGSVAGKDHNSGKEISLDSIDSRVISIQTPANLIATIATSPAQTSEGQSMTIVMSVTNTGQSTAEAVMSSMQASSENSTLSLPTPDEATIPGGGSQDFTWSYTSVEGDAGDVMFSGEASGEDQNSGEAVISGIVDSDSVTVQAATSLKATIVASPAQVNWGQDITVVMTITNTGQSTANAVTPSDLTGFADGTLSSSTPVRAIIPGGGSQDFTWVYTSAEGDVGDLMFSGSVSGKDHNSGDDVSSVSADSNIVTIGR